MRVYSTRDVTWKANRVYISGKKTGFSIERDEKYPEVMWRVRHPNGFLSEMVNLTRAHDAAQLLALRAINPKPGMQETMGADARSEKSEGAAR